MGTQWSNKRSLSAAPRHLDSLEEFQPGLKFPYCTHETRHHRTQKENFPQGVRCILSCCIVCLGPRKLEALQCCNEKDILACQIYSTAITTYHVPRLIVRAQEKQQASPKTPGRVIRSCSHGSMPPPSKAIILERASFLIEGLLNEAASGSLDLCGSE